MLLAILTAASGCIDPAAYGAVPDDANPDTAAIQKAIDIAADKGGKVCLGKGVFIVERPTARKDFGSLKLRRGPIEMYGTGPQTIIRMTGDGLRNDWRAIEIRGAREVYLHDFAIDGLGAYNTEEQTHLLDVEPGSADITINRMTFGPMKKPSDPVGKGIGGDCIRLLGKMGDEVKDVSITNSRFVDCDRSGVSLQRALRRVLIAHCSITGTGDQSIDFEPTGKGTIEDVAMIDLDITHVPGAQGPDAVAIGGHKEQLTRRITLSDSRITGGGVRIIDAENVQLLRNKITFGDKKAPVISILRRGNNIRIANNTITRLAASPPGPLVAGTHLDKYVARGVMVENNELRQETPAPVVRMTSINDLTVRHNKVAYTGTDTRVPIVNVTAVIGDIHDISVTDNQITGEAGAVLVMANRDHRIRSVEIRDNQAPRSASSMRCAGKPDTFENISADADGSRLSACKGVMVRPVRSRAAVLTAP